MQQRFIDFPGRRPKPLHVPRLQQELQFAAAPEPSHEVPQRRETLPVHVLREGLQRYVRPEEAHQDAHGRSTVQVQPMREELHAEMLSGESLPQGPWCSASVRVQRATHKGERLRHN